MCVTLSIEELFTVTWMETIHISKKYDWRKKILYMAYVYTHIFTMKCIYIYTYTMKFYSVIKNELQFTTTVTKGINKRSPFRGEVKCIIMSLMSEI